MAGSKLKEGSGSFIYNKRTGQILGRTGNSWLKILIFYVFLYAALTAFFTMMMYIWFFTLKSNMPNYVGHESLIGANPGVSFRPRPDNRDNVDSSLIRFDPKDKDDYQFWVGQLANLTRVAKLQAGLNPIHSTQRCDFTQGKAAEDKVCEVRPYADDKYGPCVVESEYGYSAGSPCVLIKLNRIYDWTPHYVTGLEETTTDQKKEVKDKFILSKFQQGLRRIEKDVNVPTSYTSAMEARVTSLPDDAQKKALADSVWIYCTGETPGDAENVGKITYYPHPFIPSFYFPFKSQKYYVSPYIYVHFERLTPGILINVECRAISNEIHPFDRVNRGGSTRFQFYIEQ